MTGTGDFGRRISYHRHPLGLTAEQMSARADMSADYVQHLEGHLGTSDPGTVTRLATALETTVKDLLGGGRDRPPGPGSGLADAVQQRDTVFRLLPRVIGSGQRVWSARFHQAAVVTAPAAAITTTSSRPSGPGGSWSGPAMPAYRAGTDQGKTAP